MKRPRVLIADDHRLLREAFASLLASECEVIGAVADGRTLLAQATELKPDVVVLDIAMPLLNGLDAARQLRPLMPEVKVVFLTVNEDPDLAAEAFRAGASAFVLKNSAASELLLAIKEAVASRTYVTPIAAGGIGENLLNQPVPSENPSELSTRQREVLQLLAEGHAMKEIARILKITTRTVAFHKYKMMNQLSVRSNAELVQYAIKHHLVSI